MTTPPFQLQSAQQPIDLSHGFLPGSDPLQQLPELFTQWERFAENLPNLLMNQCVRQNICQLPEFPVSQLNGPEEIERAMLILSFIAHAYVWQDLSHPEATLPEIIAIPWYKISQCCQRPPVLSYASYALYNWRRLDPQKPIALGNLALNQPFLGGADESWFILVHIDIEQKATLGLSQLLPAQQAAQQNQLDVLVEKLKIVAGSLQAMCDTLNRMPEYCDPYIYYHRVRPYIHGWKDNPALQKGLIYRGVAAYKENPQQFKGETGAQSSIIPAFDLALNIAHQKTPLKQHLDEMPNYMPASHRNFLDTIKQGFLIRQCVIDHLNQMPTLRKHYNECVQLIAEFRSIHLAYAINYM